MKSHEWVYTDSRISFFLGSKRRTGVSYFVRLDSPAFELALQSSSDTWEIGEDEFPVLPFVFMKGFK